MIARIIVPLLLLIVLPDLYLHWQFLRRHKRFTPWLRLFWWLPALLMLSYALCLSATRGFAPENILTLYVFLLLLGLLVVPKAVFALCSAAGLFARRLTRGRRNWGNAVGLTLSFASVAAILYGSFVEPYRLTVRQVEFCSPEVPTAFDGYRIAHFSDAHVGSYVGSTRFLQQLADTLNAQRPDLMVFTGDLQNTTPAELVAAAAPLRQLRAPDGVFSVLGNHDYSFYLHTDKTTGERYNRLTRDRERQLGWQLLLNEHRLINRGTDSLYVAGMENDGRPPFPQRGDIHKTMAGIPPSAFTILLQHDPTSWRRTILPGSHAQLTLSGHTHGGQVKMLGWSPASTVYQEWGGLYYEGQRALCVSTGTGGLVPFRLGIAPEVVVITLRRATR